MAKKPVVEIGGERRGFLTYKENPYMPEMTVKSRRVVNKRGDMVLVKAATGEIESQVAGYWELEEVDSTQFVKLFAAGMRRLKDLKSPGVKVLEVLYLIVRENPGKDQVFMSFANVHQLLTPMSLATYTRGVRELIDCEFIAPSINTNIYWINPSYFFNGDRLAFVKMYYLKDTESPIKGLMPVSDELSLSKTRTTRKNKGEKTDT